MGSHLVVDVSGHGLGHLGQVAPVVRALQTRLPALRVTVRGVVPAARVAERIPGCVPLHHPVDVGMVMASGLDVLPEESLAAYRGFHARWDEDLEAEAKALEALAPDLLLADVPYRSLAAARRAGVAAVAFCSLNWGDILGAYCGHLPGAGPLLETIRAIYREVPLFLQPAPHMPMPGVPAGRSIGPAASVAQADRDGLRARLGLPPGALVGLLAMGGVPVDLPLERWPRDGLHWVASVGRPLPPGFTPAERLGLPFVEVLAASDVVVTKPGYGMFTEAACHGVPVVYVRREDWPEEPGLEAWLAAHGRGVKVPRSALADGAAAEAAVALAREPRPAPVAPGGVEEAVAHLVPFLSG
jgi:hypothetical protein